MPRTWFTADTHFGHDNIVYLCRRPFMDAADIDAWRDAKAVGDTPSTDMKQRLEAASRRMDETLIRNWNDTVSPEDDVWHLGDFHHSKRTLADDYLRRLNGRLHLVRGNHDPAETYGNSRWAFSQHYAEHRLDRTRLVLFHYAMRTWNGSFGGKAIQLFGHSHGMLDALPGQCDVGVDCWDFRPVSLDQIKARIDADNGAVMDH